MSPGGPLHGTEEAAHSTHSSRGGPHPHGRGQRGRGLRDREGTLSGSFHTERAPATGGDSGRLGLLLLCVLAEMPSGHLSVWGGYLNTTGKNFT